MPRDNSNKYRNSSPKDVPLSLSLFSNYSSKTCLSNEQVSVCLSEVITSLFIQDWNVWECSFIGRADFFSSMVITTFIIFQGLFDILWGRLLFLLVTITLWPIHKRGFGPFTIADMINPQWGLIQWIIYQIIIRIHFAVTLFQHSLLTRRVFFNNIRRERGLYHQQH